MNYFSGFDPITEDIKSELLPRAQPFWLQSQKNEKSVVVICLHGFTGTTHESRPIGEAVHGKGLDAMGFLNPAHGLANEKRARRAMNSVKMEDWLEATRTEIKEAYKRYDHVYIYGQSMGGVIALIMAQEKRVEACALTAPAIRLPFGAGTITTLLGWTKITTSLPLAKSEIDIESYNFESAHAGYQLLKMARIARKNLNQIECPVFEAHSKKDDVIHPKVAKWIENEVQGPVEIRWFNDSGHTMPLDKQGPEVAESIADFFVKCAEDLGH